MTRNEFIQRAALVFANKMSSGEGAAREAIMCADHLGVWDELTTEEKSEIRERFRKKYTEGES